jgi:hypothetical protein
MKRTFSKFLFSLLTLLCLMLMLVFQSCVSHDTGKQCNTDRIVSFESEIKPIITTNCAIPDCHNGDNGASRNWTELSNLQQKREEVKRRVLLPKSDGQHMPKVGSISDNEIQLIVCWVEQGAQDN